MHPPIRIEPASLDDAAAVAAIYAHHVKHGIATFDTAPPSPAEMEARLNKVLTAGWPWLVAREENGEVVGFAYADQFRSRPAYRYTCEDSVYIHHDRRGQGIGRALLALLIVAADRAGFRQMIAVIGGPEPASQRLHAACGFTAAGRLLAVGRKRGEWVDTLYMQRALGPADATAPPHEPD